MKNWFKRLGENFKKTSNNIKQAIISKKLDASSIDNLEEALLSSDLGINLTQDIIKDLKSEKFSPENTKKQISDFLIKQFNNMENQLTFEADFSPHVILIFGVNGSGKTTTIAKIANRAKKKNLKINIVAADTFRAAATEQLDEWGKKINVNVIKGKKNEDPSSVIYKAHNNAIENKIDLLIIDTAGRLHNKKELMEELIYRV